MDNIIRLLERDALRRGGNANNGTNAGFACVNANNAFSNANANNGAQIPKELFPIDSTIIKDDKKYILT